jgi:hypothetical protein
VGVLVLAVVDDAEVAAEGLGVAAEFVVAGPGFLDGHRCEDPGEDSVVARGQKIFGEPDIGIESIGDALGFNQGRPVLGEPVVPAAVAVVPAVAEEVIDPAAGRVQIFGLSRQKKRRGEAEHVPADESRDLVPRRDGPPVAREVHEKAAVFRVDGPLLPARDEVFEGLAPPVLRVHDAGRGLPPGSRSRAERRGQQEKKRSGQPAGL